MKKTNDVADEVAQQECSNNNCYSSTQIYIDMRWVQVTPFLNHWISIDPTVKKRL